MKVLVLNCGSSSLKYQLIETDLERMQEEAEETLENSFYLGREPMLSKVELVSRKNKSEGN